MVFTLKFLQRNYLSLVLIKHQAMGSRTFAVFTLNPQLRRALDKLEYKEPTPIQYKAIPLITAGHDVMGIAQTGTGKTAAFLLPLLMKIKYAKGQNPRAIIMTPTRELADQIYKHTLDLSQETDIRSVVVYGGTGFTKQIEAVEAGVDIVVGTPGRLWDLYRREVLVFKALNTLVLDEADKMMDMGFMPQLRRILEVIPLKRQNLLFSATMPEGVKKLSEEFLEFPRVVEITPQATVADTVDQWYYKVPNFKTKVNLLAFLLEKEQEFSKVIVFVGTKKKADNIFKFLKRKTAGEVRVIHSNKAQNTRLNSLRDFKNGRIRILVSTDVSARGIDVSMVSHVINFQVPKVYEDYVHRIGRTGRAQNQGIAITFVDPAEEYHLKEIEKIIRADIPLKELPRAVAITPTGFDEKQYFARQIDRQKRKEDPDFQGAFHQKKRSANQKIKNSSNQRRPHRRKR